RDDLVTGVQTCALPILIVVGARKIPVRAVRTRSERLKDAVDRAYLEKYNTPGSIKYARDLGRAKSRATTTELVPLVESLRTRQCHMGSIEAAGSVDAGTGMSRGGEEV